MGVATSPSERISADEREVDVRFVGSVNGCYTLSSRRNQADKKSVEVFACRVLSMSPLSIAVTAPVIGSINERLSANVSGIGILAGRIARTIPDGFVFDIDATMEQRKALAAKIRWLKRRRINAEPDRREHKRVQPRDPRSTITLADGRALKCMLIDISRSGAAVSADTIPEVGDTVVLGKLNAKVVRPLGVGFAVQFDEVQEMESLEGLLAPLVTATPEKEPAA